MSNYDATVLGLGPDSYWKCNEPSGATLADTQAAAKNLTITGTPTAYQVASGFVGVDPIIDLSPANTAYAAIGSTLTPIASNKFSIGGWFYFNGGYGTAFSCPIFCASYVGGHVDPFYSFFAGANASSQWRIAINTTGTFTPLDTGVAMPSLNTLHHIALSYNGTLTKLFVDDIAVVNSGAITGALNAAMGSFALNTIPASTVTKGPVKCGSVAYWHDYALTQADIDLLWASRLDSGVGGPAQVLQQARPIATRFF